ncbi:MAG: glycosyltransferase family 4 protein [Gemmatimonadales bacterium]
MTAPGAGRPTRDDPRLVIGFDAVRAFRNRTGLGNYARGVLRALRQRDPALEMHLYSPWRPRQEFAGLPAELGAMIHLPAERAGRSRGSLWREFRAGRAAARDGVRLFHGLSNVIPRDLPRSGVPGIVTIHDLIFEQAPHLFRPIDRWSYRRRFRWSATHAAAVVADSHHTSRDLVRRYHLDPTRITVIPPPRDLRFAAQPAPDEAERMRVKYRLPPRFLLSVGTLEPRKNQRVLIEAIAKLGAGAPEPLVLIGRDGGSESALRTEAAALGVADRVWIETAVESGDLAIVMRDAAVFLYPSRMEGFGMPIVEALSAGVPVVAANGGHLDDAAGPDSRYVSPDDAGAWAEAIAGILGDPAAADRMRTAGLAHAAAFDPRPVADALLSLYRRTLAAG